MPDLQKSNADEIVRLHNEIIGNLRMSLKNAIRIGELLTKQKADMKHGEFGTWIKSNLPFTDRTARNYMRLYSQQDLLKTETVSDLKSAYRLLESPKPKQLQICELQPQPEKLTIWDYEPVCMRVSKDIQESCTKAVLHPIKMDNFLFSLMGDPDVCSCSIWYEIASFRDRLVLADYKKFALSWVEAEKAHTKYLSCKWDIEDFEEEHRRKISQRERKNLLDKSQQFLSQFKEIEKEIHKILTSNGLNMIDLTNII
jgi:hypothetical protein